MIRASSTVNHDAIVENHVFIGPGVTICGNVKIGEGAYLCAGAVTKDGSTINPWSTVGMGAITNHDVKEGDIVAMSPAKSIKGLISPK